VNVETLMTHNPKTCGPGDTLDRPAQLMWDNDCGCVPVVDEQRRPIGMVTDRDICMCAYTQGLPLAGLRVSMAMSRAVVSCSVAESVATAERRMRKYQIHRLPVVDRAGGLVGVLSLNDIAREAMRERVAGNETRPVSDKEIAATLGTICSRPVSLPTLSASA